MEVENAGINVGSADETDLAEINPLRRHRVIDDQVLVPFQEHQEVGHDSVDRQRIDGTAAAQDDDVAPMFLKN